MSPLFITSIIGIVLTVMAMSQVAPSAMQAITSKKIEVSVNKEEALFEQILRYRSLEGTFPSSMNDLETEGYWRTVDNTNGFGSQYSFAIDLPKGMVTINSTMTDADKKGRYINNFRHALKPVDAGSNVVSRTFILPSKFLTATTSTDNIIASNTAPDAATNGYWYDTSGETAVLKVSNGTQWVAFSSSGSGSEAPVVTTPILDTVTNATVAYSTTRKLKTGQTRAFMAMKGTSSNEAQLDIGFTSGDVVDESALSTFVSSHPEGRMRFWYDQSGNALNASSGDTWSLAASLYKASAGGLMKQSNKPSLRFNLNSVENYYLPSGGPVSFATLAGSYTIFMVAKPNNNVSQMSGTPSSLNGGDYAAFRLGSSTNLVMDGLGYDITSAGTGATTNSLLTVYKRSGDREIRLNGTTQTTSNVPSTRNNPLQRIGSIGFSSPAPIYDGFISELIIYERALTDTEIQTVENNIKTFYGI